MKFLRRLPLWQDWSNRFHNRKASVEAVRRIEARFYATILAQPAVQQAIEELGWEVMRVPYGVWFTPHPPKSVRFLLELVSVIRRDKLAYLIRGQDDVEAAILRHVQGRAEVRRMLWGVMIATLLVALIMSRAPR